MKSRIKEIIASNSSLIFIICFVAFQLMGLILAPKNWYYFIFNISIFLITMYFFRRSIYSPKDIVSLKMLIADQIKKNGINCDLNHIDISRIKDLSLLFYESEFNGDISKWNVAHIENMDHMFEKSHFEGDISKWNVSNVKSMKNIFRNSVFNGDIKDWDVRNVEVENITSFYFVTKNNSNSKNDGVRVFPPYWAKIDEKLVRDNAVTNHLLYKDLKTNLKNDNRKEKKLKL